MLAKKSVNEIVSDALSMCLENRRLRQQLKEVSKVLKSSESKCKRLSTDLGLIKNEMSSLLTTQSFEENKGEFLVMKEPNTKFLELQKQTQTQKSNEEVLLKDKEPTELLQVLEVFEKQSKELNITNKNSNVRAIWIACFTENSNENEVYKNEGLKEILALENKQDHEVAMLENDFNFIDWLFIVVKYGLFLLGLALLAKAYIRHYLERHNLEISIHSKNVPYF